MAVVFRPSEQPTIPFPEPNTASLLATCVALKQAVETLLGTRGDRPAARVFLQNEPPTVPTRGDLWLNQLPSTSLSYYDGTTWQLFAITHADGTLHST